MSPMSLSGLHLSLPNKTNNLNLYSDNPSSIPTTTDSDMIPSMNINTTTISNDDSIASPSPSSSGIVADMNDSNLETNQVHFQLLVI
ncbi:unnamed protein product [Anisakis simplex]|uniref:Ovule protein n=1 Tax=Anisakis simplex TaxID=6269 RepID=A0A0M3JPJ5_ANISI|nr:unnamed protein product [Anisakis simplex]